MHIYIKPQLASSMIMRNLKSKLNYRKQIQKILPSHQGWTLVELVTTLVIIAILAVFVAPNVLTWQTNMRVSSAARDLYAALNSARVSAVENNANVVVAAAATPANTFTIFVDDGGGTAANAKNNTLDAGETTLDNYTLNSKVTGRDYRDAHLNSVIAGTVGFTSRGMPIGNNTGAILVRNSAGDRWFRIVLGTSGSLTLLQSTDSTDGTNGIWK